MNRRGFVALRGVMGLVVLGCFDTAQAQSSLTVSSSSLSFTAQAGTNAPLTQSVMVAAGGNPATFTISSDSPWLVASTGTFNGSNGVTPATLIVQVNASTLPAQTYSGTLTLRAPGESSSITIGVSLFVRGLSSYYQSVSLSFQQGHPPPVQTVDVQSSGKQVTFSFAMTTAPADNCPQNWLRGVASSNMTPANLTVTVEPTALAPGTCSGTITLIGEGGGPTETVSIPVSLSVSKQPLLSVAAPGELVLTVTQGQTSDSGWIYPESIFLTSTDPATPITFTATSATSSSSAAWLSLYPSKFQTPAEVTLNIDASKLAPGTYTGSVTIASSGLLAGSMTIPVILTVRATNYLEPPLAPLMFVQAQGGPVPMQQSLTLFTESIDDKATYTATATTFGSGDWLQLGPASGPLSMFTNLPVNIQSNNLAPGDHPALITISFSNSSRPQIAQEVTLVVLPPASAIKASPSALTFGYQSGGALPPPQTVTLTGGPAGLNVGTIDSPWLSANITNAGTSASLVVSVNPQALAPGAYHGTIVIEAAGAQAGTLNAALYVSGGAAPQPLFMVNAASTSGQSGLAPGEIVSIKGQGLGPSTGVPFAVNSQGTVDSTLAGVQVFFDGIPGTPLYVSATQINVTVPWELAVNTNSNDSNQRNVVVSYQGMRSTPIPQGVYGAAFGIFTLDGTGKGQAVAINQDGTVNGAASPAVPGSIITVYATGGTQTSPKSTTGMVNPISSPLILSGPSGAEPFGGLVPFAVGAQIGGQFTNVLFAGAAPGDVTGVVQLNIQVPEGVSGNALPLTVSLNGLYLSESPSGPTVAVR
jgi:uncharacterized protein (TIGR03437 family)